jgi:predicted DNA-binding transcriptional regulator AlpA
MTTAELEPLWTVDDVSRFLGIPVPTLYDWRKRKRGPVGRRVGKHLRYDPNDVREWFKSLTR